MNLTDLAVYLGSNAVFFAIATWLLKDLVTTRLENSVKHEFSVKLDSLRSELKNSEKEFQLKLDLKELEIEGLRNSAMAALSQRRISFDARRMKAIEEIWSSVRQLGASRVVASNIAFLHHENVSNEVNKNLEFQKIIESLGSGYDQDAISKLPSHNARPFVTPIVWANYKAYETICTLGVFRWKMLKLGIYNPKFVDSDNTKEIIKAALPQKAEYIDKHGESGYTHLLDELENRILVSMKMMLTGVEDDDSSIKQAAEIIEKTNKANDDMQRSSNMPQA